MVTKSWLIRKDSDAGRDWGQEEKRTTEDEMAGWHHWLDGRESEWAPGVGGGQRGLVCCYSWGCKESDTTERLNWTELKNLFKRFLSISQEIWNGKKRKTLEKPWSYSLKALKLSLYNAHQKKIYIKIYITNIYPKSLDFVS